MNKFKICPVCGFRNNTGLLECRECDADLMSVPVTDENTLSAYSGVTLVSKDGKYKADITAPETIVGRDYVMQEYLKDKSFVSRMHVKLSITDGKLFVKDMDSTNHTYINDKLLPESGAFVSKGDEISLGGYTENGTFPDKAACFVVR